MFGTLGGQELILIFVLALIIFGPRKLPEIGKSVGKMLVEFRRASNDFKRTLEEEVEADKLKSSLELDRPELPAAPPAPSATVAAAPTTDEASGSGSADPVEPSATEQPTPSRDLETPQATAPEPK